MKFELKYTQSRNITPVIFVPGVFGSMSNVIVPGTGNWSFGIAKYIYQPFIDILESMGYKENENLFIAFYDWRKSCSDSAKNYLLKVIDKAKIKTGIDKVNVICHSMGGLVTRSYVQSDYYNNDVDKLIIMATASAGSPPNFSYWTGGKLPGNTGKHFNFARTYMDVYLWILGELYGNKIEAIHEHFPGLRDLMPSKQYGDYLYFEDIDKFMKFKSQTKMKTHNPFLDELNENMDIIKERNIDVTVIAGIGENTVQFLKIVPSLSKDKWVDGRVVGLNETTDGDGNATIHSVFLLDGEKYIVHGSHVEMMYKSEPIIRKKLLKI